MVSKTSSYCSIVAASTQMTVDSVCMEIISEVKASGFSEEDIFAVHLALEEALTNAIKHGNKMDADKDVKIDYSVCPEKVDIIMTDEGNGFNPDSVPDPRCGDNIYRLGGRGLLLIRSYMDVVEFNKKGNTIHMVKHKETQSA